MDCRIKSQINAVAEKMAKEYQQELAAKGTLMDLEELTYQIGDEIGRKLCEKVLANRGEQAAEVEQAECPDCGAACTRVDVEPVVLDGLRGPLGFSQPKYYCRQCRRSFFPSDGKIGDVGP